MVLKTLIEQYNKLTVAEERQIEDDYIEVVINNAALEEWSRILTTALDHVKKPAGTPPTEEDLTITDNFGGIHDGQTLFQKKFDEGMVIAMLWPWGDQMHTTIKIIFLENNSSEQNAA